MNVRSVSVASSLLIAVLAMACGEATKRSAFSTESSPTEIGAGGGSPGFSNAEGKKGNDCAINSTSTDYDTDFDGDGFTLRDDCNECNTSINKGAHDIPGNGIDEDCTGTADDEPVECDANLTGDDPFEGAKAIGLCKKADEDGRDWGVIEANWVKPDGKPLANMRGVGILEKFGALDPQLGKSMLVLSSGDAQEGASGQESKNYTHGTPEGYPKESPACPNVTTGTANDGVALELRIRVPSNAKSFSYQQNFFTMEYPTYICSRFNDFFVTMLSPKPKDLVDGNIAFDQDTNPISVNNSLLQVCAPGEHSGKNFPCPLGPNTLTGTGFEDHAATGWLTTSAPVVGGEEITIRFAIWDSGDGAFDSTVLLDDFRFSVEGADTARTKPSDPK